MTEVSENQQPEIQNDDTGKKSNFMPFLVIGAVAVIAVGGFLLSRKTQAPNKQVLSDQSVQGSQSEEYSESKTEALSENESSSSSSDTVADVKTGNEIQVEGGMYYFKPNIIKAKKGQPITILFTSKQGIHDFVIDEFNVQSQKIRDGQTDTVTFTPDKTGTFEFYCSIASHRAMGMKGSLIVE